MVLSLKQLVRKANRQMERAARAQRAGRFVEADTLYRKVIKRFPEHADAWHNLAFNARQAVALAKQIGGIADADLQHDIAVAVALHRGAIQLAPGNAKLYQNLADLLYAEGRNDLAMEHVEQALQRSPDLLSSWVLKGRLHGQQGDRARSDACFNRALAIPAQSVEDDNNLAFIYLRRGEYAVGFSAHESRLRGAQYQAGYGRDDLVELAPMWQGESLDGKAILLYGEQGNGDHLQFVRYAAVLREMGAEVMIETLPALVLLFRMMLPRALVMERGKVPSPPPDFVLPMMSAPALVKTTLATVPPALTLPSISVSENGPLAPFVRQIDAAKLRGRVVGIGWEGSANNQINRYRSIPAEALAILRDTPGVTFVNLQPGQSETFARQVGGIDPTPALVDFAATAAVMQRCDAVIGIDSAVSHLAGSIGVPLHVALSFHADWRWLEDRTDSPWYPSATLYRQPVPHDWTSVLTHIRAALATSPRDTRETPASDSRSVRCYTDGMPD